jgi:hypothetical protein
MRLIWICVEADTVCRGSKRKMTFKMTKNMLQHHRLCSTAPEATVPLSEWTPIYRLRTNTGLNTGGRFWFTGSDLCNCRFFWCSSNWCRERLRKSSTAPEATVPLSEWTPIYRLRTNTGKFWKMDIFTSDDMRDTAFRADPPYRTRPLGSFNPTRQWNCVNTSIFVLF